MSGAETAVGMSLGDHLAELRRRLMVVVLTVLVVMIGSFAFQMALQDFVEQPWQQGVSLANPESLEALGIDLDDPRTYKLRIDSLPEGAINPLKISIFFALIVCFPLLVYQVWMFVLPGLYRNERNAGFLLVPAAVIFFYCGVIFGYFLGLPYFMKFLIEFIAKFNSGTFEMRQNYYYSFLFMMCLVFGAVMDIPWAILVLVKARLVTPQTLAAKRKIIYISIAFLAAVLSPPDPVSQLMIGSLMVILFEAGLLASRLLYNPDKMAKKDKAIGEQGLIGHMVDLPESASGSSAEAPSSDQALAHESESPEAEPHDYDHDYDHDHGYDHDHDHDDYHHDNPELDDDEHLQAHLENYDYDEEHADLHHGHEIYDEFPEGLDGDPVDDEHHRYARETTDGDMDGDGFPDDDDDSDLDDPWGHSQPRQPRQGSASAAPPQAASSVDPWLHGKRRKGREDSPQRAEAESAVDDRRLQDLEADMQRLRRRLNREAKQNRRLRRQIQTRRRGGLRG